MTERTEQRPAVGREAGLSTPLAITMLVILALSYVVNSMDRQVFPVLLPAVSKELGITLSPSGLLTTIFTLGIAIAGFPAGHTVDRYSRKYMVMIGIAIYSIFTLLTPLAFGFGDMLFYRATTGIGEGMQQAAMFAAVGAYFYRRRAVAIGALNFAFGAGSFLGPFIGGLVLQSTGSWKLPLYIFGALGLIFIPIVALGVSKKFTEKVELGTSGSVEEEIDARMPERFFNRNVVLTIIIAAGVGLVMFGYLSLYPTYLQGELGFDPSMAGFAASMFGVGALMGIPAGHIGDRFNQRWVVTTALAGVIVTSYFLFNVAEAPFPHYVLSFFFGTFASGFLFVNVYALMQRSVKTTMIGRASGSFIASLYGAAAFSGYIFGFLVEHFGWSGAAAIQLILVSIVAMIAMFFVDISRLLPKDLENR
jgi:MFS family permease